MVLTVYVNIYVHMHISRHQLSLLTKKKFSCALVENIDLATTMEIHFTELAFVVASRTFKTIARCFRAFSGVGIGICVKKKIFYLH